MKYYLENINKSYEDLEVLKSLNLEVEENRITTIMGPSGCGKSTLLNIVAGTIDYDSGELTNFEDKIISYLFQEPRLLPWKTVYSNIEFVMKHIPESKRDTIIRKNLELVGLWDFKDYYPKELSGGMKQRAAIARTFSYPSDILLMDEPFKSVDHEMKVQLIKSFQAIWESHKRTVIFVTHDKEAEELLSDVTYSMNDINNLVMK